MPNLQEKSDYILQYGRKCVEMVDLESLLQVCYGASSGKALKNLLKKILFIS